jgi:hypothetical protein
MPKSMTRTLVGKSQAVSRRATSRRRTHRRHKDVADARDENAGLLDRRDPRLLLRRQGFDLIGVEEESMQADGVMDLTGSSPG